MQLTYSGSGTVYFRKDKYKCDLYLNKKCGGILINISVDGAFASFLEFPLKIKLLSGELSTGYKFSLLNCSRGNTKGLVSEGITVFSYYAQYMVEGIESTDYNNINFYKVRFQLSDIIKWGNVSGYKIENNYGIIKNDDCEENIFDSENYNIKYIVEKTMLPLVTADLLKEDIVLKQIGNIEIILKKEKSIEEFVEILEKVKRLIELSTLRSIYLNKITGWNKNIYDIYEESKHERPISIISSKFKNHNDIVEKNNFTKVWEWITLPELIENKCFNNYFCKYEKLEPIIELYIQIIVSNEMSNVRAFLNLVQALETYHSRFKANSIEEFRNRINNVILKDRPIEFIEDDKKFLMAKSYKFITLESRIADLLTADFNIHFDIGDIEYLDFPKVIADTRNYYIHYDESIKDRGRVLENSELSIYNRSLINILEYYILLELGFSNIEQIRKKLKERWGNVSDALTIRKASERMENKNT